MFPRSAFRIQDSGFRQSGFALVTAIFILVVLAGLGAAMVSISSSQHATVALDIQSTRAYQAARAGIEWGAYQALQPTPPPGFSCPAYPATASYAIPFTGTPLAGFISTVTCNTTTHSEGANTLTLYMFTATATYGTVGDVDYVARQVSTRVTHCAGPGC